MGNQQVNLTAEEWRELDNKKYTQKIRQQKAAAYRVFIEKLNDPDDDPIHGDDLSEQFQRVYEAQNLMINIILKVSQSLNKTPDPQNQKFLNRYQAIENAKNFSKRGWYIVQPDQKMIPLTDPENLLIESLLKKFKKDKTIPLQIKLHDKLIDLATKTVKIYAIPDRDWPLVSSKLKQRPEISEKLTDYSSLILFNDGDRQYTKDDMTNKIIFALMWFERNNRYMPTMNQILWGLACFQVDELFGFRFSRTQRECEDEKINQYRIYQDICIEMTGMSTDQMNDPLQELEENCETNKINKFILWLYTIEPPFYLHVNNAARFKYMDHVDTLGPFIFAFGRVIQSNKQIKIDAKLYKGIKGEGIFLRAFNLFRGVRLEKKYIEQWDAQTGRYSEDMMPHVFELPSMMSTSLDFEEAIWQSRPIEEDDDKQAVIFCITVKDHDHVQKICCDMTNASAFSYEREVLLCEGAYVYVLDVHMVFSQLYGINYWIVQLLNTKKAK